MSFVSTIKGDNTKELMSSSLNIRNPLRMQVLTKLSVMWLYNLLGELNWLRGRILCKRHMFSKISAWCNHVLFLWNFRVERPYIGSLYFLTLAYRLCSFSLGLLFFAWKWISSCFGMKIQNHGSKLKCGTISSWNQSENFESSIKLHSTGDQPLAPISLHHTRTGWWPPHLKGTLSPSLFNPPLPSLCSSMHVWSFPL